MNGPSQRRELLAPSALAAHTIEKRDVATWTCPRAGREPACYVGVRKWRSQRQVLRGLPRDRVPQPFAGCTVAEQEEAVTGTDFALPDGVTMCGLCRTPVYFEHHYSGSVHAEKEKEKAEAAAAGGRGRVRKRSHLSDSRLLELCRQRCAENSAFAAMLAPVAAPAPSSPPRAISAPPVPHQAPPVACLVADHHAAAVPPPTAQSSAPQAPPELWLVGPPLDGPEQQMVVEPHAPLV